MSTPIEIGALPASSGLRISGELDASNAPDVADRLEEQVRGATDVTVDLSALDFIDSAGMNVLINAARELEGRGRMTIRCRTAGPVRRVIDLMGVAEVLDHVRVQDVAEAGPADRKAAQ